MEQSERVASCVGATICSVSPTASEPPAPARVAEVFDALVTVTEPSDVVLPALILFTVNAALLVVFVLSKTTVPASDAGIVTANAIGTLTSAPVAGLPANANAIGNC